MMIGDVFHTLLMIIPILMNRLPGGNSDGWWCGVGAIRDRFPRI